MKTKVKKFLHNFLFSFKTAYAVSKKYFACKIILILMQTVFPIVQLYLLSAIINIVVNYIETKKTSNLYLYVFFYIVVFIINNLSQILDTYLNNSYNESINIYIDNILVDKISQIDYEYFDSSELQERIHDSWNLVEGIKTLVWQIFTFLKAGVQLMVSFILLCTLNIPLAIFALATIIPAIYFQKKVNDAKWSYERETAKKKRRMLYYKEQLAAAAPMEVRLYNLKDYFLRKYKKVWSLWDKELKKQSLKSSALTGITLFFLYLSEVGILVDCAVKISKKTLQIGGVAYYVSLLTNLRKNVEEATYTIMDVRYSYYELETLQMLLNLASKMDMSGSEVLGEVNQVEFRNVSFCYPKEDHYVLNHCSFIIKENQLVGLVGLNGSGKSTIVKLLLRLYDPTSGEILINYKNIKNYDITSVRNSFGILFQDYNKYSFTVKESIALSKIDDVNNRKEIWLACKLSNIEDMIRSFPDNINTNLTLRFSEEGKELSGGLWQRIALARAFFGRKDFYILDEPSSALDPVAEHEIFGMIKELSKNKNGLFISHRLSNILLADKIIVLDHGKIIEQGSHQELLKKQGEYYKLFKMQADNYL